MPSLPQKKKQKTEKKTKTKTKTKTKDPTAEYVKELGTELLASSSHINNLPLLLKFLSPSAPTEFVFEVVLSVQPFFVALLPEIHSYSRSKRGVDWEKNSEIVYKEWLRSRFDEFLDSLIEIAVSEQSDDAIRDVAVEVIMEFVKHGKRGDFEVSIFHKFINALILTSSLGSLWNFFASKFLNFVDVRCYTYSSLSKIVCKMITTIDDRKVTSDKDGSDNKLSDVRMKASVGNIFTVLCQIPSLQNQHQESDFAMWSEAGLLSKVGEEAPSLNISLEAGKDKKHEGTKVKASTALIAKRVKSKFTKAWTSFLKLPLSLDVYKEVLATIHQIVIPNISNPVILCDFFTRSYDMGGIISVMALSGLFILMTEHGLEYPNFYTKLYALLTPDVFMAKYRARFFQLLDTSLKSTYLPAYLAAAFAKRLSRLALSVPPSGALVIIALIHNLLRRHPSINFLVQKASNSETDGDASSENTQEPKGDGFDPFKIEESDPIKSVAMRSSLWEIETLRHHYCPAVSRFVASLENDLTVRNKTSEVTVADFASGSYSTIFGDEVRRRIKQVPLAFYKVIPTTLFSESDFSGWTFGGQPCDVLNG